MDKQGFIDFNTRLSPENSGKADSYARAIEILDNVLQYQSMIDLHGKSLYDVNSINVIEDVLRLVNDEVTKMKKQQPNIFDYGDPRQKSYPRKHFCSAALKSLKKYAQSEEDIAAADSIVSHEKDPKTISEKLINHFDLTREGEYITSITKQRRGQEYFRHMILNNYGCRCAVTGINIPQLLLASHIVPWAEESHKKDRLNPCNGICLSALYDKAFDKGLITISPDNYSIILSSAIREYESQDYFDRHFGCIDGKQITTPIVFKPSLDFLAYHRDHVFMGK